ncbi:MAG TPA: DUF1080 domain-containing protein [Verrucomicrobiae bacterium]
MKFAVSLCLSFAFAKILGAQEISLAPTHRLELFNGTNFSGFTFCMKHDADPLQTWSVSHGVIHCTGQPAGYLRTQKSFQNYALTVEWRFVKIAPQADNTGVLVHLQLPDQVWPKCIQVQGKHAHQGDLFLMGGAESQEHRGMDANTPVPLRGASAENPVGEWNSSVTICSNNVVRAYINGRLMNTLSECTVTHGFIGIQSEGAEIELRKMSLEPLEY